MTLFIAMFVIFLIWRWSNQPIANQPTQTQQDVKGSSTTVNLTVLEKSIFKTKVPDDYVVASNTEKPNSDIIVQTYLNNSSGKLSKSNSGEIAITVGKLSIDKLSSLSGFTLRQSNPALYARQDDLIVMNSEHAIFTKKASDYEITIFSKHANHYYAVAVTGRLNNLLETKMIAEDIISNWVWKL